MFDKDSFLSNNFNNAIRVALANNLKVAYSNQSFEYWLILHFEDHQGGKINREDYNKKINKYINKMGAVYDGEGSKIITEEFFDILSSIDEHTQKSRIETAIKRAERNYKRWNHHSPALEESTTTVYKLINEIMKFK